MYLRDGSYTAVAVIVVVGGGGGGGGSGGGCVTLHQHAGVYQ